MIVLQGGNGQGKTNLLEAIYFLATTRSPRATTEKELILWSALQEELPFARLVGSLASSKGNLEVEMALRVEAPEELRQEETPLRIEKRLRLNGVPRRAAELIGQVPVVMFGPDDIAIIAGAPGLRRRYLDATIAMVNPRYLRSLQRYGRVLQQRNQLLRLIREHHAQVDELSFWNQEMIKSGAYLVDERLRALERLQEHATSIHLTLTGSPEALEMAYVGTVAAAGETSREEAFSAVLSRNQVREIAQGVSLVGPHRDDLKFLLDGTDMGVYGSRGQQRTVSLTLRLAEGKFIEEQGGEAPILLLDDVLSELDAARRHFLFEHALGYQQTLITTTDTSFIAAGFLEQAACFHVVAGRIEPMSEQLP